MQETKKIYSIGHSNHSAEAFINLLKAHNITCVVDVRSAPYSKYVPQFNKDALKKILAAQDIQYVPMGEEFGARRSDPSLYNGKGYLDFEATAKSAVFLKGIERITKVMLDGYRIALMCTEQNPLDCHRFSLVARSFAQFGFCVKHILQDGTLQTQEQVEDALLDAYFPQRAMVGLFEDGNENRGQLVAQAYALKNEEIGYHLRESTGVSNKKIRV